MGRGNKRITDSLALTRIISILSVSYHRITAYNQMLYGSEGDWFRYTSLFQILKSAGYHVLWLSNQASSSSWKVAGFYLKQCDSYIFAEKFKDSEFRNGSYDGMLLPLLDDALKDRHGKQFLFLHLMGSHFHYNKRYPHEYEHFTAKQEQGSSDSRKTIRAEYDNSIFYNDFIVTEIISRFQDRNAIVIYISDHGEEVYGSIDLVGHSDGMPYCSVIEIPMVIWLSDKFSVSYPELEQRIAKSIHRPYMTDDMIHTVLDIMSIETDEYDSSRSIINRNFAQSRPRIYANRLYTKEGGLNEIQ